MENDEIVELESTPKVRKKTTVVFWIVAAVMAVAIVAAIGWLLYHEATHSTVPAAPAVAVLDDDVTPCAPFVEIELKCLIKIDTNEEIERGGFIAQSEAVGAVVEKGTSIEIHYSSGKAMIVLPELRNETVENVSEIIDPIGGVLVEDAIVNDSGLAEGRVVTSSIPAGEPLVNGGELTITISSGKLTVPVWKGESLKKVQSDALDSGINVQFTEQESDGPSGLVIDQSTSGLIPMEDTVNVIISKTRTPKDLTVPQVIGKTVEEARNLIAAEGFTSISIIVMVDPELEDDKNNLVTLVTPAEGTKVKSDAQIDLTASSKE